MFFCILKLNILKNYIVKKMYVFDVDILIFKEVNSIRNIKLVCIVTFKIILINITNALLILCNLNNK